MDVSYSVVIDATRCTNCNLCVAFCPVEVFEEGSADAAPAAAPPAAAPPAADGTFATASYPVSSASPVSATPVIARPELCWGCETCVGQCPSSAVHVTAEANVEAFVNREKAEALPACERALYAEWATTLKEVLRLRWSPVAISLIAAGEPLPDVPVPSERLRYCQSLMAARRGRRIMLPANRHACPDGTAILGLTDLPPKLASGELYKLFHKLDSVEAAQRMVQERPHLDPRTVDATVVTPLEEAACTPQVVAVFAQPEQVMWLCMSASYYTGHRFDFKASGYNAQCVETTLIPLVTGQPNISFGCYGCRASSDIGDDIMFMGIPTELMPTMVKGLRELGKKAIPQSRDKIYLPPLL
jgi:uncharacterized protein (DUF169 family)/NAD-dependent dihydropyrimidine dehydrogenase PreA subunit